MFKKTVISTKCIIFIVLISSVLIFRTNAAPTEQPDHDHDPHDDPNDHDHKNHVHHNDHKHSDHSHPHNGQSHDHSHDSASFLPAESANSPVEALPWQNNFHLIDPSM